MAFDSNQANEMRTTTIFFNSGYHTHQRLNYENSTTNTTKKSKKGKSTVCVCDKLLQPVEEFHNIIWFSQDDFHCLVPLPLYYSTS